MFANLFFAFWFFGPAGLANLAAFASGKIGFLKKFNFPADGYLKLHGTRLLGSHKTVRGFLAAIIAGIFCVYLQIFLYNSFPSLRLIIPLNYSEINPLLLGSLLGFGALAGDSIKSFFKRQIHIQPGKSWIPFDQVDYIVGGIAFSCFYIRLPIGDYLYICIVWLLIHPLLNFIGYLLGLRKKPI